MKFLCDQMLGTLAKWLRVYGFDTFYANHEMNDNDLLKIAKEEKRVLITRDKTLAQISKRENLKTLNIQTIDIDEQLKIVLKHVEINQDKILSRCLLCNSVIEEIKKEKIRDKVPPRVFKNNEKFWYCKKCNEPMVAEEKQIPVDPEQDKPKHKCKCGSKDFVPEEDVFDTWMTSSMTRNASSKISRVFPRVDCLSTYPPRSAFITLFSDP